MSSRTYRWGDEARTHVVCDDGRNIPADPANMDWHDLQQSGATIGDPVPREVDPAPPPDNRDATLAAMAAEIDTLKAALASLVKAAQGAP